MAGLPRWVLLCGLLSCTLAEAPGNATVIRHHNRIARHEARQRASQSEPNAQAYRSSQAAAVLANAINASEVSQSKEHWTGRSSTTLDPGNPQI